ncbi:copia protein [Tanacetum coccineum]|uniref:Copia protein n=1 Tax=Tanacetum coccineum TaxID=301880 RepID=A0ABQ5CYD6_9ASTR
MLITCPSGLTNTGRLLLAATGIDFNDSIMRFGFGDQRLEGTTNAIKRAPYYSGYQTHVAEYQKYLEEERNKAEGKVVPESSKASKVTKTKATTVIKSSDDTAPKPTSTQPPKPTLAPIESPKIIQSKKRKQVKETSNAPPATKQLKPGKMTKKSMSKSTLKLVDEFVDEGVPAKEPEYHDEEADLQWALELSLKELERT